MDGSPTKSPSKREGPSPLSSRRSSTAEINAIELQSRSRSASAQPTPSKPRLPDYKRCFPEFFLQSHTVLAPQNRLSRDAKGFSHATGKIDEVLSGEGPGHLDASQSLCETLHRLLRKREQSKGAISLKEVIQTTIGSSKNPTDLTAMKTNGARRTKALRNIPVKFLKFAEDVRPPYIGTYSKTPTRRTLYSLARKPFGRVRPDTNYDYDSEAEWEDPEDGEDIESDGEEEEEDEDEEEMEGFLDDEEPNAIKRRPLLGNQEPQCSGICWEGELNSSDGRPPPDLNPYRIDILLGEHYHPKIRHMLIHTTENPCFPIDPFSSAYWAPDPNDTKSNPRFPSNQSTLMEPPRIPLSPVNRANALLKPPVTDPITNKAPKAAKRFVDHEILDDFKAAVVGSNLTKMGLCEILKVRFPKQKKDAIKDTLEAVAERVGAKAAEKRWVLKTGV